VQQLEAEQARFVEDKLRLTKEVDRYRQDLVHQDTEKRSISRQVNEKEVEISRLKEEVREEQEQRRQEVAQLREELRTFQEEAKSKDKKA